MTKNGVVKKRASSPTVAKRGPSGLLDDVAALVKQLSKGSRIAGVGVGICGTVDTNRQVVLYTTDTLPGWKNIAIATELEARTGIPCFCDNDANAAAWGEYLLGAGRGTSSMVMFTLGTGVGGGIVIDGKLLPGASFTAGHLGHIRVRAGGRKCPCGDRGCLEAYASAYALRRTYGKEPHEIFLAAKKGDAEALRILDEVADALGSAFGTISCTVNPELIVLTGGIAKGWPQLRKRALAGFESHSLPGTLKTTKVKRSALGNDAGVIGAAMLCKQ